ncbi:MAG: hypothetical protein QXL19_10585 [Ignisphaera sp.]
MDKERILELLEEIMNEMKEGVEEIELEEIELFAQSWWDENAEEEYIHGIMIKREDNEELLELISKMLKVIHDDQYISADFIAITKDAIYVQWHTRVYGPFGYVGTDYAYEELDSVIERFMKFVESELPKKEELLMKLKDLVNSI